MELSLNFSLFVLEVLLGSETMLITRGFVLFMIAHELGKGQYDQ